MSSDSINLKLQARTQTGKSVKHMRREGLIPANIYERGKPSQSVVGNAVEMIKTFRAAGKHHPVNLDVEGKAHLAMIKDVDIDPVKGSLWHIAFHAVNRNETVTAEVPVRIKETNSPALKANLMIITPLDMVEVEAKPGDLPDEFVVDAIVLVAIGDRLTVADIELPDGVKIMTDPESILAVVEEPRDQIAAAAADAAGSAVNEDAEAAVPAAHGKDEEAKS